ncbi:MAG: hypothetical protein INR62_01950 [Rhodospirillales bacterium]|nr:hypothetical protein [Acetobacter sp.]
MKTPFVLTSAFMLLAFVPASRATPASTKGKTMHIHEVHRDQSIHPVRRAVEVRASSSETYLFRSRAELEMTNPG